MTIILRRNPQARIGAAILLTAAMGLLVPAAALAGHPGAAKPPSVHFSAPKMAEFHYTPPKLPQMQFTQSQMPSIPQPGMAMGPLTMPRGVVKPPQGTTMPVKASHESSAGALASAATSKVKASNPATTATTAAVSGSGRYSSGGRNYYGSGGYWRRSSYRPTNQMSGPMRRLQKLIADLDTLAPGRQVSQVHKNMLKYDLMAVAEGVPRPTHPPVQQLANDLAEGLTHRSVPALNTMELAGNLKAVMNTAHFARSDVNTAMNQGTMLLKGSGVQQAHLQAITSDLTAVLASLPNNQALGLVR
jgi:hypothetical protein